LKEYMTTKVHIVNYGPAVVKVHTQSIAEELIFPQQSNDYYVYDECDVIIKEVKEDKIKMAEIKP
jgi:hypothetical protein